MTEKEQLKSLTWIDISIIEQTNDTLLVIMFFKTKEEGTKFLQDFISKKHSNFLVTKDKDGKHTFVIQFDDSEYDIVLETKMTVDNYPPLAILDRYKDKTFLTTGEMQSNGNFIMDSYRHPLI